MGLFKISVNESVRLSLKVWCCRIIDDLVCWFTFVALTFDFVLGLNFLTIFIGYTDEPGFSVPILEPAFPLLC